MIIFYILLVHRSDIIMMNIHYDCIDTTCKIFSTRDYAPVRTLAGHQGKVMTIDQSNDGKYIATGGFDRTWKLWCTDEYSMDE